MRTSLSILTCFLALAGCGGDGGGGGSSDTTAAASTGTGTGVSTQGETSQTAGSTGAPGSTGTSSGGETSAGTTAAETSVGETGSGTAADGSSSGTTGAVEFTLSSSEFEDGMGLPHSAHVSGGNMSPDLAWVGAPADTQSFAVFFHDTSIDFNHSAIWNIGADVTGLPHDVDHSAMPADVPGAVQCRSWAGNFGYGGPGSPANFYEFVLYALDTDDLGGEIDENSSLDEVFTALEAHSLGTATLVGQSTGPG